MDIVYRLGEASVWDVVRLLDGEPGYDSVRITLGILAKIEFVLNFYLGLSKTSQGFES